MKTCFGFAAALLFLCGQAAPASAATFRLGELTEADVGDSLGDCGTYLHHPNGALIFFNDMDTSFVKIDGVVFKLRQTGSPGSQASTKGAVVYASQDGRVEVRNRTRITKPLSLESVELAGPLTVTFAGVSRTLQVKGSSGC